MQFKRLSILLLFSMLRYVAIADTFIVTTNADSGPGTLREAITMANANGTAAIDNIYFNIPILSFNDRSINLVNQLPALTSNIIIDASSQPGEAYGITNAKICLKKNDYAPEFSVIKIENARNVKIYSLYLFLGYWQGLFGTPFRSENLYGINIANSFDVEIGAPQKGNVICGAVHGIYSRSDSCRNIIIRSNFMGMGAYYNTSYDYVPGTDIETVILRDECDITLANVKDITIGGPNADDGNVISGTRGIDIDSRYTADNGFILIQQNTFGRWFNKTSPISVYDFWNRHINIGRSRHNIDWSSEHQVDFRLSFLDNDVPTHMSVDYLSKPFLFLRNKFIVAPQQQMSGGKLGFANCPGGGLIGNNNTTDGNLFIDNREPFQSSISVYNCGPVEIQKNVFTCNSTYGSTTSIWNNFTPIPFAQVDQTTTSSVKGRATASSRVDLYYDDNCTACEGEQYIASVNADAGGQWVYNGTITGTVVTIATKNGYSSQFSTPLFNETNKVIQQPTCGLSNGSITGITGEGAEEYFWIDYVTKDTVSRTIDLLNAGPGHYLLMGKHGQNCYNNMSTVFTFEDITPVILTTWANIVQPACGLNNGSISDVVISEGQYSKFEWQNAQGTVISNNLNINNLSPGVYSLIVKDITPAGGCSDTETFTLTNQSGPSLNFDNVQITSSTCTNSNGSVSGITSSNVTGTPVIEWINQSNVIVGNSLNLQNVPAGKYKMKFKDQSTCGLITTPEYTVSATGVITIDVADKIITPSGCIANTGSIQNIHVTNATSFDWKNIATNITAGSTVDVLNLSAATYRLTASNATGCSATVDVTVPQAAFTPITINIQSENALCGENNGSVKMTFNSDPSQYNFRWINNSTNQLIGNGTAINNLGAGIYLTMATDANGCEKEVARTTLQAFPVPSFDYSQMKITNDVCALKKGGISGITLNGASGATVYRWININNDTVSTTLNLQNVLQGQYKLIIRDGAACKTESNLLSVSNINATVGLPLYDDLIVAKNSTGNLVLKNIDQAVYSLYATLNSSIFTQQNTTGNFSIPNITNDTIVYVKKEQGSCNSPMTAIKINVIDKTIFTIASGFTPNNDGLNDKLNVKIFGYLNLEYFKIFNRNGEEVFSTKTINDGWDGKYKGMLQPGSVFVWIAKGKDINGKIISDKGTFVLIR